MHFPTLSKNTLILWLLSYTVTTCNGYGVPWRSGLAMTHAHGLGLIGDTRVVSVVTMRFSDYLVGCGVRIHWLPIRSGGLEIFCFPRSDDGSGFSLLWSFFKFNSHHGRASVNMLKNWRRCVLCIVIDIGTGN